MLPFFLVLGWNRGYAGRDPCARCRLQMGCQFSALGNRGLRPGADRAAERLKRRAFAVPRGGKRLRSAACRRIRIGGCSDAGLQCAQKSAERGRGFGKIEIKFAGIKRGCKKIAPMIDARVHQSSGQLCNFASWVSAGAEGRKRDGCKAKTCAGRLGDSWHETCCIFGHGGR